MIKSTSQAGQDKFAFYMSGCKKDGIFIDIGCNDAQFHSNSFGLEQIGWTGLLLDIAPFLSTRKSPFIQWDATTPCPPMLDFINGIGRPVDYLSIDVDGPDYEALTQLPILGAYPSTHGFGVITIEHDLYLRGPANRDRIRSLLLASGYDLVCSDVIAPGYGQFEDWYVHPDYASKELRDSKRMDGPLGTSVVL